MLQRAQFLHFNILGSFFVFFLNPVASNNRYDRQIESKLDLKGGLDILGSFKNDEALQYFFNYFTCEIFVGPKLTSN